MRMRVGGDGSVQSGKWLQTWVRNKLLCFCFFLWSFSYPTVLIYHPPRCKQCHATYCQGFEIAAKSEWTRRLDSGTCYASNRSKIWRQKKKKKIHRLQTDSVMIAPPGLGSIPVSRHQDLNSHHAHKVLTWEWKVAVPWAELPEAWKTF